MLDSNFFTLDPNNQLCGSSIACTSPNDIRLGATLNRAGAGAWDVNDTDIIGLGKSGTLRAFVVPEPDSLILISIGFVMLIFTGLRCPDWMALTRIAVVQRLRLRLRAVLSARS